MSRISLKLPLKMSLVALSVLNLNSLIRININQLSTRKQDMIFNYCHRWITALGLQAFNSLRLSNWAVFVWCGGLAPGQRHAITSLIINPWKRISMDIESNTSNFILKMLLKVSVTVPTVLNLNSLICINTIQLPRNQVSRMNYCPGLTSF